MTTTLDRRALLPVTHGLEVGPWNTGIPSGTVLTPSGAISVTANDQLYEDLDIIGGVVVTTGLRAIFRRCRIIYTSALYAVNTTNSAATSLADAVTLEDCEVYGGQTLGASCFAGGRIVLRRVNAYGGGDVFKFAAHTLVEDSWIHHPFHQVGGHNDVTQVTSGTDMVIRRSALVGKSIDSYQGYELLPAVNGNAALQIGNLQGSGIDGLTVEDCYMNGGNYTVNSNNAAALPSSNILLRRNVFGDDATFGAYSGYAYDATALDSSNVYLDDLLGLVVTGSTGNTITVANLTAVSNRLVAVGRTFQVVRAGAVVSTVRTITAKAGDDSTATFDGAAFTFLPGDRITRPAQSVRTA